VTATTAPAHTRGRLGGSGATGPLGVALAALGCFLLAGWLASGAGVHHKPIGDLLDTFQAASRALIAAAVLFAVCGFGVTRLLLPEPLRRHEAVWVLPVGACVSALALTVLGYAYVPFQVSLPLILAAGAAAAVLVWRRRGGPKLDRATGWPVYVAVLLVGVALAPYLAVGFPTVSGDGSDAHLAVGTADFLQNDHPTAVDAKEPTDQVPVLWRSKTPIYYALAAVSSISGLKPWQALTPVAALMLAMTAAGFFLLARELLGAALLTGLAAMGIAGLNRMALHTGLHPYFNQTWGYFTLPFCLVLAWWTIEHRSRGAAALLAIFLAVEGFAYPLALPIPLVALAVFALLDWRRTRGTPQALPLPRLWRGRRSLLWMVPVALVFAVPVFGVLEKTTSAAGLLLNPDSSLEKWAGDLFYFIPAYQFFSLPGETLWWLEAAAITALAVWGLTGVPRPLAAGLGTVLAGFLAAGFLFRHRDHGQYFEFKTLAFVVPLLIVCAVAAAARLRAAGVALILLLLLGTQAAARTEVKTTGQQLFAPMLGLRAWDRALPPGASVRLDMPGNEQIWVAYMLSGQPLCSRTPLLYTAYPHVQFSRQADYILITRKVERIFGRPRDATVAPPVRVNKLFRLYRAQADLPGRDRCSRLLVQTVTHP
jgi:hypothetical protein